MTAKLRRWLRDLAVLLLLTLALIWGMDRLRQPTLPATFSQTPLRTLDGETLDLAALSRQRPLLIYVQASWCVVCRYTTPAVARLAAEGGNVISIALRSGDDRQLAQWLQRKGLRLPVVNDPNGELARRWRVQATPTLAIVSQGKVVAATTGWTSYWGIKFRLWRAQR